MKLLAVTAATLGLALAVASGAHAQNAEMSFFITSQGPGNGGNLGGLDGADAHCQQLAQAAGSQGKTWRAYLSTSGDNAVNARDRIGAGPWYNAKGVLIARDLAGLHSEENKIDKETGLNEKGEMVNGRGDQPNRHDILTGSTPEGTAISGAEDRTCSNWSSDAADGHAMVGHHDRMGLRDDAPSKSWNSSHPSRGCGQQDLRGTGGDGLLYCFAAN